MSDSPKHPVRVRFAPSPTGYFHIGSARTVLFNWLFARQNNGKFILRIEDTDVERSRPEFEQDILEGIKWLGLDWDEKLYRQSERLDIYEKYLKQLLDENKAYYCFCSKEQLEEDRKAMLSQGLAPKYSGRCSHITQDEALKKISRGEQTIIRFRTPSTELHFEDVIRGKISFNAALIGDVVIARNLHSPLFNFSGAVDDFEMKITHVIRGEDHLSNTPKQIFIQKALGFNEVKYAHLPLILAPDRSKMSKRFLETSLNDYRQQGYLAEALVNFLALLGWHPKEDKELLSCDELIKEFDLKRVQKAGAIFNAEKLEWLNAQYVKKIPAHELAGRIKNFIPEDWQKDKKLLAKAIEVEKERIKKLSDFQGLADFFFELSDYQSQLLVWPRINLNNQMVLSRESKDKIINNLKILIEAIQKIFKVDFNKENLEKAIMPLTEVWGRGELLWPLRAALSGKENSPGPFEIMETLDKEETLRRLEKALEKLS